LTESHERDAHHRAYQCQRRIPDHALRRARATAADTAATHAPMRIGHLGAAVHLEARDCLSANNGRQQGSGCSRTVAAAHVLRAREYAAGVESAVGLGQAKAAEQLPVAMPGRYCCLWASMQNQKSAPSSATTSRSSSSGSRIRPARLRSLPARSKHSSGPRRHGPWGGWGRPGRVRPSRARSPGRSAHGGRPAARAAQVGPGCRRGRLRAPFVHRQ